MFFLCISRFKLHKMKVKQYYILFIFVLGLTSNNLIFTPPSIFPETTDKEDTETLKKSLILLEVTPVYNNYIRPWLKQSGTTYYTLGLVLPNHKILSIASDLERAIFIEALPYDSYQKSSATIEVIDLDANLALLSISNSNFFSKLKPLPLGDDPLLGDKVEATRIDKLFQIYKESTHIQDLNLGTETGLVYLPTYNFHLNQNFTLGSPLICEKKICGLISFSNKEGGQAIPPSLIKTFIDRANKFLLNKKQKTNSPYTSLFASQGFSTVGLVDPVTRYYYKIPKGYQGVLISKIIPKSSAWGILERKDLLLEIEGIKVDSKGNFDHPKWGRQNILFLFAFSGLKNSFRKEGEIIKLTIFRKGKIKKVDMPLKIIHENITDIQIPTHLNEPKFIVEGGITFTELSLPLLSSLYGDLWHQKSIFYANLFRYRQYHNKNSKKKFVIITGVFPDETTVGWDDLHSSLVHKVDGKRIENLEDFYKKIKQAIQEKKEFIKLHIFGNRIIYLDLKNRDAINKRIFNKYGIPKANSWDA